MKTERITVDLLLAEMLRLRKNAANGDQGMSSEEIAKRMRISLKQARELIRKMAACGKMECRRVPLTTITGTVTMTPRYFPIQAAK